jgi:two-component system sensor histidine kinase HydH
MKFFYKRKLYVPALSIVAAVVSLLLVIGISTYRNIDRETKAQRSFVHRQGLVLLRAIEAGARSGMVMPMWGEDSVARLLYETGKDDTIAYIYIVNDKGIVSHHSVPSLDGSKAIWLPQIENESEIVTQIRYNSDGSQVYDLAKIFSPKVEDMPHMMPYHKSPLHKHKNTILVLGLSMHEFEAAREADIQHAFVMAAIVLALGSGTFFFIFVIQNYYLVDRTLKHTQDYTRQVVANMANGLLSLDKNGKLVSYNEVALNLLELDESNLKDIEIDKVLDFKTTGILNTLSSCQKVMDNEFTYKTKLGGSIPLSISSTPIENELGVCDGVVIVLRDLRELKDLEEKVREAEKLAAIGKLAASVAHEVRNPLSSIRGFAQYLNKSMQEGTQQKQYAQIMIKEVDRINRVINDLLTFSRPIEIELKPTKVTDLIAHAVGLVQADADLKNVTISVNTKASIGLAPLDENQMTQVILNLLLNAMSAVEDNGLIEIHSKLDSKDRALSIEIEDDGDGISPEFMENIFEPFVTSREKGTGIGLAIVKKIIENHGGKIEAVSPPTKKDKGSSFKIKMPI